MKNCHFKLIFSCHNRKRGLRREGNNARMLIIFLPCYNNWISIAISASKHLSLYIIVLYKIHSYSQFVKWACIMWKKWFNFSPSKRNRKSMVHPQDNCTNRISTKILSQKTCYLKVYQYNWKTLFLDDLLNWYSRKKGLISHTVVRPAL